MNCCFLYAHKKETASEFAAWSLRQAAQILSQFQWGVLGRCKEHRIIYALFSVFCGYRGWYPAGNRQTHYRTCRGWQNGGWAFRWRPAHSGHTWFGRCPAPGRSGSESGHYPPADPAVFPNKSAYFPSPLSVCLHSSIVNIFTIEFSKDMYYHYCIPTHFPCSQFFCCLFTN